MGNAAESIAIIGIGCRFPGAWDSHSLWELLCSGRDVLTVAPEGRYLDFLEPGFGQSDLGRRLSGLRGGFLEHIDRFDAAAFNISAREARAIDPQHRLLLETSWEALDDGGQDMRRLTGEPVGVYVGVWGSDYQARLYRKSPRIDLGMTTGGGRYAAAGRLSYSFGWVGPSLTIDTACSSSLVAVHMACQALRAGECTLAIAGGANIILDSAVTIAYLSAGALSPEGRCKFGDASANGYARAEGAGVVVLKTLQRALADGDPIHAIVRGSAVTHTGKTGGSLVSPGEEGQLYLLRQALAAAGLRPADLDYVEAHGTGTRVGDRIELRALGNLLREDRAASSPCLIGSIKSNIGHTESAAGIAGLIKAILCLKYREVPGNLHFRQPNPEVPWKDLPLRIVTERTPLSSRSGPAFAGVNSFGITGTFAHVILEEAPGTINRKPEARPAMGPVLLPISARSQAALAELAGAFAQQIRRSPEDLPNVAFSAGLRRTHHEIRLAVLQRDAHSVAHALEAFARGETARGLYSLPEGFGVEPRMGWRFSGDGPRWPGMGVRLYQTEPVFQAMIARLETLIEAQAGWSLLKELRATGTASRLEAPEFALPAVFSIQIAIAELLKSWGLKPTMVAGEGAGEVAAAFVAGIFSLEDAVRWIRGQARMAFKSAAGDGPEMFAPISPRPPRIPMYSAAYGRVAAEGDFAPENWTRRIRQTAQFGPLMEKMAVGGCNLFVEIGPHPPPGASVGARLDPSTHVVETLPGGSDEAGDLRRAAAELYVRGCDPDWRALVPPGGEAVPLPGYPWQRESYWIDERASSAPATNSGVPLPDPLLQRSFQTMGSDGAHYFESEVSLTTLPWLGEHRVQGRPIFPAAGFLMAALKAAGQLSPGAILADIELQEACFVPESEKLLVQFRFQPAGDGGYALDIFSSDPARLELCRQHVKGRVFPAAGSAVRPAIFIPDGGQSSGRDEVYAAMRRGQLDYGEAFQGIEGITCKPGEALAMLTLPRAIQPEAAAYGIHPATFDAVLQTLVALVPGWSHSTDLWMPRAVGNITLHKLPAPGASLWARATTAVPPDPAAGEMAGDVFLLDERGEVLLAAQGVQLQRVGPRGGVRQWLHEVRWECQEFTPGSLPVNRDSMPSPAELENRMRSVPVSVREKQATRIALANLNRIGGLSVGQAFLELGFRFLPGRQFTTDEAAAETGLAPRHRQLFERLLQMLWEDELLSRAGDQWRVERAPVKEDLAAELRAAGSIDSEFADLWQIFTRASLNLAAVLAGRVDAVEVLFGGDGAAALERLYSTAAIWRAPMRQVVEAVSAMVERLPEGRTLRLLEIGAGTGGLTAHVLPLLPPDRTAYVFTDLSRYFVTHAREKFANYPFLSGAILDLERDPALQGFAPESFDLILASNCLHATRNLRESLAHVRQLLVPGGYLLLQEETAAERWTDLIFGLTDGWWRFQDHDLRPDHPLLSPRSWLGTLPQQGFTDAAVLGGDAGDVCGAAIVLARKAAARTAQPRRGRWLLLSDSAGVARQLDDRLRKLGQDCLLADSLRADAAAAWLAGEDLPGRTLVDLRPLDAILSERDGAPELAAIEERALTGLLELLRDVTARRDAHPPRVVLVTGGSQAVGSESAPLALAQAPLWSTARVAALEHPRFSMLRIDLEPGPAESQIEPLAAELLGNDGEPEVALRQGTRFVPRLLPLDTPGGDRLRLPDGPFTIEAGERGALDCIEAQIAGRPGPAAGQVEIRVTAAGVNFKDVLNSLGALDRQPLGLECSGFVTALGAGVSGLAVGDEVMAAGPGGWGSYFNTSAMLVAPKPPQLRLEQAAALPIAYLTAHYALRHIARIASRQRVLIHSGAGGVGLAAVYLALAAGAEVFATAGSPAKRDYLRSLGVPHVFSSRTLDFAGQIRSLERGELNVILNCFSGEFIPTSLELLAPGGHFIELGKRDVWTRSRMGERRPDVNYQILDLAGTMRDAPETLQPMLRELTAELAGGKLPPLPIRAFPVSQVVPALRYMQQGRQTGKVVLKLPAATPGETAKLTDHLNTGSWLITGGWGGLGLALAEWLVGQGARQLILMGRRPPHPAALEAIERLRSRGAGVLVETCDVANEPELAAVLERAARQLPALRGVFHLAGVLDDAPLSQLSWPRFADVYRPKVLGAWNLHRLTAEMQLDCFVLFSSLTSLLGSPGQANHASANAFLGALAQNRRTQGMPAQSIDWGAWRDLGSAALPERLAHLARQGIGSISPSEGFEVLAEVMGSDLVQVGVSPIDPARWRASQATPARSFARGFEREAAEPVDVSLREALVQALPGAPRRQLLESCIQQNLARVLQMNGTKFDVRKSFTDLGLDSLTSLELRNHLEHDTGIALPVSLIYNHATIATAATELASRMGVSFDTHSGATGDELADDEVNCVLSALRELPAEDAFRLLALDPSPQGDGG